MLISSFSFFLTHLIRSDEMFKGLGTVVRSFFSPSWRANGLISEPALAGTVREAPNLSWVMIFHFADLSQNSVLSGPRNCMLSLLCLILFTVLMFAGSRGQKILDS